jgi:3-phenylpropionate/trans-cinnamate dioxygenase ferredoxin reductase subunit
VAELERVVIVGGGLAGATAAATLRAEGYEGGIALVAAEARPPYERPPLSKELLRGEQPFEKALVRPEEFYAGNGIELLLGTRAVRIDPVGRRVELAAGESLAYDAVLVATGGANRPLPVPGAELGGVLGLRTVDESERIRAAALEGGPAVVVGMGFIGSEVAASLRELGVAVTAVEPLAAPLARVLGPEVGGTVAALHRAHGVELLLGEGVEAFEGDRRVERVVTSSGRRLDAAFVVTGVGIAPAVELFEGTGVELEDGAVVDALGRTRVDGIWAAGDVARHEHPVLGRRVRVEHFQHAHEHGAAVARAMLGKGEPYAPPYWFWSDQYDANLQLAGLPDGWDELLVRGSLDELDYVAFYLAGGRVVAAAAMNRGRDLRRATPLVASRAVADRDALRDEGVDLRDLG